MLGVVLVFLLCVLQTLHGSPDDRNFGLERVVENVLQNYGESQRLVRPARNTSLHIGVSLVSIAHFNQNTGRATLGVWLKQSWTDPRLHWEDSAVTSLYLPADKVWKPDLRLYGSLDYNAKVADDTLVVVTSTGETIWVPPAEYNIVCSPAADDWWRCPLQFGSWVHNAWQINLGFYGNKSEVDTEFYDKYSYGFEVESDTATVADRTYDCCPEPYASATFQLKIRRFPEGRASVSGVTTTGVSVTAISGLFIIQQLL